MNRAGLPVVREVDIMKHVKYLLEGLLMLFIVCVIVGLITSAIYSIILVIKTYFSVGILKIIYIASLFVIAGYFLGRLLND